MSELLRRAAHGLNPRNRGARQEQHNAGESVKRHRWGVGGAGARMAAVGEGR